MISIQTDNGSTRELGKNRVIMVYRRVAGRVDVVVEKAYVPSWSDLTDLVNRITAAEDGMKRGER